MILFHGRAAEMTAGGEHSYVTFTGNDFPESDVQRNDILRHLIVWQLEGESVTSSVTP